MKQVLPFHEVQARKFFGHFNLTNTAARTLVLLMLCRGLFTMEAPVTPAHAATLTPRIVSAPLTTKEVVVADAVVTDSQYGADPNGNDDSTAAFQNAIRVVSNAGGGVVYAPDGTYKISGTLSVPNGVTLRGDWTAPGPGAAAGTILKAYSGQGNAGATPFITLGYGTVRNLSIWYPNQGFTSSTISAYPYTIESPACGPHVRNITLFNSYQGVHYACGGSGSIDRLYATCLLQCVTVDRDGEWAYFRHFLIADTIWHDAPSAVATKPQRGDMSNLRRYTTTHLVGVIMKRNDDTALYGITVSDALKTVSAPAGSGAQWYGTISIASHPLDLEQSWFTNEFNLTTGVADSDLVPQANGLRYGPVPVKSPRNRRNFYDVQSYGADPTGAHDATRAIQSALNAAFVAGGGTVYVPAGTYRVSTNLNVPSGVELRGSWEDAHENQGALDGTILEAYQGQGTGSPDTATAFITVHANAGVRGVTVYYPNQSGHSVSTYPFTFRSAGTGIWLTNDAIVDPYNAVDLGANRSDGFVIQGFVAAALNKGIVVGAGSSGGWLDEVVIDPGPWVAAYWPNHPGWPNDSTFNAWVNGHTQPFLLNNCRNLQSWGADVYMGRMHTMIGSAGCSSSTFWGSMGDNVRQGVFQVNGGTSYRFVVPNIISSTHGGVVTPLGFGGTVTVYGWLAGPRLQGSTLWRGPGITVFKATHAPA
jgi:Pectate lyase superfamily protein